MLQPIMLGILGILLTSWLPYPSWKLMKLHWFMLEPILGIEAHHP